MKNAVSLRPRWRSLTLLAVWLCAFEMSSKADEPPRLVVVIVVDQMLPDYLSRYGDLYQGGIARLLRDGAVFDRAYHDYSCTLTGPGHATLSTGTLPAHHGIVGNNWFERALRREVYCCEDSTVHVTGHPKIEGVSPARMLRPTLAEMLKTQSANARVVSVALKDRSAVLSAGRHADLVLWLDEEAGQWVTSSYYADTVPNWVPTSNDLARLAESTWVQLLPDSAYRRSDPDDFANEFDEKHTTFPHGCRQDGIEAGKPCFEELYGVPYGDLAVLNLAERAMDSLALGKDQVPDLLLVGCSAADGIGHRYGPDSHEVQDYYLRLDQYLDAFFNHLDSTVGEGRWVVALSSDHGVLPIPERDMARGVASRRVPNDTVKAQIRRLSEAVSVKWKVPLEVKRTEGGLAFTSDVWTKRPAQSAALDLKTELSKLDWVADVYTRPELEDSSSADRPYEQLFRHALCDGRGADLFIREDERMFVSSKKSGTTHGSPYTYDTHVPLIFMGPGIAAAHHQDSVRTVDLAPTLSELLGLPAGSFHPDGVSLQPLLRP